MYGFNFSLAAIILSMTLPTLSTLASSHALPKMNTENLLQGQRASLLSFLIAKLTESLALL